jgi:hypothetical protein
VAQTEIRSQFGVAAQLHERLQRMLGRHAAVRCWRVYIAGVLLHIPRTALRQPASQPAGRATNLHFNSVCVSAMSDDACGTCRSFQLHCDVFLETARRVGSWKAWVHGGGGWRKGQRGMKFAKSRALETSQAVANFTRKGERSSELLIFSRRLHLKVEIHEKTRFAKSSKQDIACFACTTKQTLIAILEF